MKFSHLPIGQRFELDGAVFVKTSPMMAAKEGGGESRFLARYVVVKVLGGESASAAPREAKKVDEATVRAAFDQFHTRCRQVLARLEGEVSAETLAALLAEMEEGKRHFLDELSRP